VINELTYTLIKNVGLLKMIGNPLENTTCIFSGFFSLSKRTNTTTAYTAHIHYFRRVSRTEHRMSSQLGYLKQDIKSTNNNVPAKTGDVLYASPSGMHRVVSFGYAATVNVTAAAILGGFIIQSTSGGAVAFTLPTVPVLVASMNGACVNNSIRFAVRNTGGNTLTVTTTAGWTMSGVNTIATIKTGEYLAILTSITPGSETATIYTIANDHTH
jgi:hypothetical protein